MWSHDEQKEISNECAKNAMIRCPRCGEIVNRYIPSWYTGGSPCVITAKYCKYCRSDLNN